MAIEAVIFDMDGVLVDTEPVWEEVRKKLTLEVPWYRASSDP